MRLAREGLNGNPTPFRVDWRESPTPPLKAGARPKKKKRN